MTASDIVEFLRDRLDEDEAVARAANTDEARRPWSDPQLAPVPESQWGDMITGYLGGEVGEHCARWDPARVLAEVAAKRAIIALHRPWGDALPDGTRDCQICGWRRFGCLTLLALAQPDADHPDWDPAWSVGDKPRTGT